MQNITEKQFFRSMLFVIFLLLLCVTGIVLMYNRILEYEKPGQGLEYVPLHTYDYVMEVGGDSITVYTIYDCQHNFVGEVTANQLDSLIIDDNL